MLGIFAVMVGGFVFALWFGAHRSLTGDASLTASADEVRVISSVSDPRYGGGVNGNRLRQGQQTKYEYRVGSQRFVADAWVQLLPDTYVPDDEPIVRAVCYDPEDPSKHALLLTEGAMCGDGAVGEASSSRGKPVDAP